MFKQQAVCVKNDMFYLDRNSDNYGKLQHDGSDIERVAELIAPQSGSQVAWVHARAPIAYVKRVDLTIYIIMQHNVK